MKIEFKGSLKPNSGLKFSDDGGQIIIDYPENEKANVVRLAIASRKMLKFTVEFE